MSRLQVLSQWHKNSVAILAVLWLAACSSTAPVVEEAHLVPRIFELELQDNRPGSNGEMGTISLEYVELAGYADRAVEEKINQDIKQRIGMDKPYDGSEDLSFKVRKAELGKRWLHFMAEGSYYKHGAANGQSRIISVYFDVQSGDPVQLSQLFQPGYQPLLNKAITDWLEQQPYPHNFTGIRGDECFYKDGRYLTICFSEYDIAPGSAGVVIVPVDKLELKTVINPAGLLAQ